MPISTITAKGQTTLPKAMRDYLGVRPHDRLCYTPLNGQVILTPLKGDLRGLKGAFKLPAWERRPLDFKKLRKAFEGAAAERAVRAMRKTR